jgi:hypothetical protein
MVVHDKTNGQWEEQSSIWHDELRDMGRFKFGAHGEGGLIEHIPHAY